MSIISILFNHQIKHETSFGRVHVYERCELLYFAGRMFGIEVVTLHDKLHSAKFHGLGSEDLGPDTVTTKY